MLRVPQRIPGVPDRDTYTYTWCHGAAGTPADLESACLRSLRASGVPERLYPGFWDNDGRCCGTAGVGDIVLSAWQRHGRDEDLNFAVVLGDALVARAVDDGDHAYWRFVEHRKDDPLLPPGPGWMQGAAGIGAWFLHLDAFERGAAPPIRFPDSPF